MIPDADLPTGPLPGRRDHGTLANVLDAGLILLLVVLAHLLLSSNGFSPTDEGYYLSNARRLLNGEVPHRDFITLRPAGAYLLFTPVVAFGGDATLWIARLFVWLEFGAIAYIWTHLVDRELGSPFDRAPVAAVAAIAFTLTVGWYPIGVTTSVEGYFAFSVGLALATMNRPRVRTAGYFILGFAYLCRQNLLFAVLLTLLALDDWRRARYVAAAAAPGVIYLAWLGALGGLDDFFIQLTAASSGSSSPGGFLQYGVVRWLTEYRLGVGVLLGAIAGALGVLALPDRRGRDANTGFAGLAGVLIAGLAIGGTLVTMRYGRYPAVPDFRSYSFVVFGLLAGLVGVASIMRPALPGRRLSLVALALAWSLSFSWAAPSPTLALGPLVLLASGYGALAVRAAGPRLLARTVSPLPVLLIAPFLFAFYGARQGWIGLDPPASRLTHRLDGVFPGARFLRTDSNTYAYLIDLQQAIAAAPTEDLVLSPDMGAYWVTASRPNPVPINWLFYGELVSRDLEGRVRTALERKRGSLTVIASKVHVPSLVDGFKPVPPHWSPIQNHVVANYEKIGETRFFELYR